MQGQISQTESVVISVMKTSTEGQGYCKLVRERKHLLKDNKHFAKIFLVLYYI